MGTKSQIGGGGNAAVYKTVVGRGSGVPSLLTYGSSNPPFTPYVHAWIERTSLEQLKVRVTDEINVESL